MTGPCLDCGIDLATAPPGGARGRCSACYQRAVRAGDIPVEDLGPAAGFLHLDLAWHEDALCAETDPDMFFPEKGGSPREAIGICEKCLVRAECLDFALETRERFGIWGGLSERRRRKLLGTAEPDAEEAA